MAWTSRSESPSTERDTWPADSDILWQYDGKWYATWEQFAAARLDKLMPRQPKREWGKR